MKPIEFLYSIGWHTIRPLLSLAGWVSPKVREAVEGRTTAVEQMRTWAASEARTRDAAPLLWLHGASAGELAGAAPVVAALRKRHPELLLAVTYSSPSGAGAARRQNPDYTGYAPLETRTDTFGAIRALEPAVLVYAKLDVWPGLSAAAQESGVPSALVNATVRPGSSRLHQPARALTEESYASLDAIGAVSERERSRLVALGARPDVITVTGDAAFDQALARVTRAREGRGECEASRLPPPPEGALRVVGGSTWAADEAFLTEAVGQIDELDVELVLVPHEPTPAAIERIRKRIRHSLGCDARLYSRRGEWSGLTPGPIPPIVVDAVGFLAELYLEAHVAYVGGGLDGTGLHSVIEPAAAGLPVLFGSRHDRWDADDLVAAGGAVEVEVASLAETLRGLFDEERRVQMGRRAEAYVHAGSGAAEAAADMVESLLLDSPGFGAESVPEDRAEDRDQQHDSDPQH